MVRRVSTHPNDRGPHQDSIPGRVSRLWLQLHFKLWPGAGKWGWVQGIFFLEQIFVDFDVSFSAMGRPYRRKCGALLFLLGSTRDRFEGLSGPLAINAKSWTASQTGFQFTLGFIPGLPKPRGALVAALVRLTTCCLSFSLIG